jgi:hypothetical protein
LLAIDAAYHHIFDVAPRWRTIECNNNVARRRAVAKRAGVAPTQRTKTFLVSDENCR